MIERDSNPEGQLSGTVLSNPAKMNPKEDSIMSQASEAGISPFIYTLPSTASFTGKGFLGYSFGALRHDKDIEVLYVESEKGHDTFFISKRLTRIYYILAGSGYFTLNDQRCAVGPGMLVEVPPGVEYTYSGKMTLIAFCTPRWKPGNEVTTKWNPDVVQSDSLSSGQANSWLTKLVRFRAFGKSPVGGYLRLNQYLWNALPSSTTAFGPIRVYGEFLHALSQIQLNRAQAFSTYFLRNRAELELIRHLLDHKAQGDTLRVAVLGCSTGPEAYSVAWTIRSARPDLNLVLHAVDISRQAVAFAEKGVYSLDSRQLADTLICSAMTPAEMESMFQRDGDSISVKSWIREGMHWQAGDAGDPELVKSLGPQDMVVANNFLCHMEPQDAEKCLRNIARLVNPQGFLFFSGVDLGVRTKVASDLNWQPVEKLMEEVHEGDRRLGSRWPCHYAAIEPLNKKRPDWKLRYSAAFQVSTPATNGHQMQGEGAAPQKKVLQSSSV
jgi:chemotaxis methyl-accepting protein methylase/mannose-6-phosphate isomerase-like protein (cupin superfamily)